MKYLNVKDWDRETTILFVSMILGSYAWITSEHILLGVFLGMAGFVALTALHEACAQTFSLPHLSYVHYFENVYLPLIKRLTPRLKIKRQV